MILTVVLPQPSGVVGVLQSVDVCKPPGDAAYDDQLVAGNVQLAVGVRFDVLEEFGSADSVSNNVRCARSFSWNVLHIFRSRTMVHSDYQRT